MDDFINLHVHTDSSALDGLSPKKARFEYLTETLQQPALAITDHGTMSGVYEFWHLAQKYKVKPILGVEAYLVDDMKAKVKGEKKHHVVLLAKNIDGYRNILQLQYLANRYGFYGKPRIDHSAMEHYAKGVICLSACTANDIMSLLIDDKEEEARKRLEWYKQTFGDDFYLEFEPNQSEQLKINMMKLYRLWQQVKVKAVITADAHYITESQYDDHSKLLLVNTNGKVGGVDNFQFSERNLYLHSREEIIEEGLATGFEKRHMEKWCDNTLEIMGKIEVFDIKQPDYIMPPIPEYVGENWDTILRKKCVVGLKGKQLLNDEYMARLAYELKVIYNAGFSSYFLVVADIVGWAKGEGIFVGPGRGSAAGSIISYALGITDVDPITYDLQFERFLNPERLGGKVLKFLE